MADIKSTVKLIDRLIELTQEKKITWERVLAPLSLTFNGCKVKYIYITEYKNKNIRVYEETYKHYHDEDEFYWSSRVNFEFFDAGESIYDFPEVSNARDLLKAIQYRDVDIDSFMNDIFND